MNSSVRTFGLIALFEGISYILLLGIAMPMKYALDMPLAVKLVGWAHGIMFMAYMVFLLVCWSKCKWSIRRVFWYFVASLLPFVPFWVEKDLKREYKSS